MGINFKDLISSDQPVRNRGIKSARKWLSNQTSLDDETLLKISHALFYCLWMQDKPILQQDLSTKIAQLLTEIKSPQLLGPFFRSLWCIIGQEWPDLDKYRLDKVFFLIKQLLEHLFRRFQADNWNLELVRSLIGVLNDQILANEKATAPPSLRLFVVEYFGQLLAKVAGDSLALGAELSVALFTPFLAYVSGGEREALVEGIRDHILHPLRAQSSLKADLSLLGKVADSWASKARSKKRRILLQSFAEEACGFQPLELTATSSGFWVQDLGASEGETSNSTPISQSLTRKPLPWLCTTTVATGSPKRPSRTVQWDTSATEKHFSNKDPASTISKSPQFSSPLNGNLQ